MSISRNEGNAQTFVAGAAIEQHARVKLTSGKLALAGAADRGIGTTRRQSLADGDHVSVLLNSAPGTRLYVASAAIAANAEVEAAASGRVATLAAGTSLGTCLTAAAAAGDVIEVAPAP